MRLIDADAFKKSLETELKCVELRGANDLASMIAKKAGELFLQDIDAQPSIWHECDEDLPENPRTPYEHKCYLCVVGDGIYSILGYCDGWNCSMNEKGEVCHEHEIKDIVRWMELPK